MFRSVQRLYGETLAASDGEIGQVKDFYFDNQNWAVRYLVVDADSWLPGREVLVSPHSLTCLDHDKQSLRINLTRKQIRNSPSIQSHQKVSRQFEEEYCRYYGLPRYWQGEALRDMSGFPVSERATISLPGKPLASGDAQWKRSMASLLSTKAAVGGGPEGGDNAMGHIQDFMIDLQSWAIRQLVVKTGHRFSSEGLGIPTNRVERISWDKSSMFINLTRDLVE